VINLELVWIILVVGRIILDERNLEKMNLEKILEDPQDCFDLVKDKSDLTPEQILSLTKRISYSPYLCYRAGERWRDETITSEVGEILIGGVVNDVNYCILSARYWKEELYNDHKDKLFGVMVGNKRQWNNDGDWPKKRLKDYKEYQKEYGGRLEMVNQDEQGELSAPYDDGGLAVVDSVAGVVQGTRVEKKQWYVFW
jgi:hypothetical protein